MLEVLRRRLNALQYTTFQASAVTDAIDILQHAPIELLITDMRMPGLDGMHLVRYVRQYFPDIPVLVITGFPSVSGAVDAVRSGAADYLAKPFTAKELKAAVEKVLRQRYGHTGAAAEAGSPEPFNYHGIIGRSEAARDLVELIERVKDTRVTTLIQGESGTGKELVARAIHYSGRHGQGPFVAVHCGAIPENLLESELFGFVKGAFTDAHATRPGFFQAADGGTIFLDEIGSASPSVQTRLLRVIQEKEVQMIGAVEPQRVDLRIIAATNSDLHALCQSGRFREDLYYRLNVIAIHTPPLRERRTDIPLLAHYFLDKFAREFDRPRPAIAPAALEQLQAHHWPGNIRELENVIQRALILCDGRIEAAHLPPYLQRPAEPRAGERDEPLLTLKEVERRHIHKVLEAVDGNKSAAARILGINRKTLRLKLREDEK